MKILIICGHPDEKSFNHEIFATYAKSARENPENEVKTLDLGKLNFDPVLRYGYREIMKNDNEMENSRKLLKWAEKIVFVYPIWFSSMPSLLKGWIDRTLTPNFAYNMKGFRHIGHLRGKIAEIWLTADGPAIYYKIFARTPIKLIKNHILKLCGIKVSRIEICGNTHKKSDEQRKIWLSKVAKIARNSGAKGARNA